jgi:hypothetical protein
LSKSHRNYRQLDRTLVTQTHPCCHRSWLWTQGRSLCHCCFFQCLPGYNLG